MTSSPLVIFLLTGFTMISFAANSLLCRMALSETLIDPASFTTIRLASGAVSLLILISILQRSHHNIASGGSWISGLALFTYAGAFSLAYISLNTGTGAIILFGSVQITMITSAIRSGEKIITAQWLGMFTAFCGLVYLMFPGISAPDTSGAILMCVSGVAWSIYSIRGRGVSIPFQMTYGNFLRAVPFSLILIIIFFSSINLKSTGVYLAILSGAVTSGIGYVLWYKVLKKISTTQASVVQLLVPVLAALGGVYFLSEEITFRLVVASVLIFSGVGAAVFNK